MEVEERSPILNLKSELESLLEHCKNTISENFGDRNTDQSKEAYSNPNLAAFEGFLQNVHNQFERHFHTLESLIDAKNKAESVIQDKNEETVEEEDTKEVADDKEDKDGANACKRSFASFINNVFANKSFEPVFL